MKKTPQKNTMWEYLEASGVLASGTEAEIKAIKKIYRKKYLLEYKQKQRTEQTEFSILLSKKNGEYETVKEAADRHKKTITAFLKLSALAYIRKGYIIPDKMQISRIEQLLMQVLNEIKAISGAGFSRFSESQNYEALEKKIEKLEADISEILRKPIEIEEAVKREVSTNPELKQKLIHLLSPIQP